MTPDPDADLPRMTPREAAWWAFVRLLVYSSSVAIIAMVAGFAWAVWSRS